MKRCSKFKSNTAHKVVSMKNVPSLVSYGYSSQGGNEELPKIASCGS